ncbi:MAG: CinA family nicotinamide mononucleotide deamidase-related protein [Planctomycetia bacterium]|nr:CinA family nicotinamide mononucleotide deamidase-related protein [Planctomycetia bacterium]
MHAEVISIGDELTSGQRVDTNSAWLSQRLGELGIAVRFHTTVSDDLAGNIAVFRAAIERADVVVATGGLGPTADDLTREAVAAALGCELVLDPASLAHIESLFARRNRPMPERNRVQAMFPAASRPIPNPNGTAPGIAAEVARASRPPCYLFCLPGVPAEMFEMWRETVAPALSAMSGSARVIRHHTIKCYGVGESQLESMLPDLIRRGREPSVGITVHGATISLRITATGDSAAACETAIADTASIIRQALGDLVFGEGDDELQDVVLRQLAATGRTLSTSEVGTAGRLAFWLAEAARRSAGGASFLGGLVLPQTDAKSPAESPQQQVARMAIDCRTRFAADFGLAIGPVPLAIPDAPLAEFHIALATAGGVSIKSDTTIGHPAILHDRAAKQALDMLRHALLYETSR